ncbi:DUF1592 domain-containing protein [Pyxidicoccus xibeiensis]|uniref:DUF1592 domain-containing protein n=1 Tax=Pyxidicoccus xibeiensis TaxID=2906759 RepID=UPI0020A6E238|nr:DUF1592 domain-containing protein [Pyxidicoccus xibeiensis]MCP3144992.1 DUF1592 domain-containing protein [Pyxidicoccus xibeiensis]
MIHDPDRPGGPGTPGGPGPAVVEQPARSVRMARLTHAQWSSTVQELLRLDAPPTSLAEAFRADPSQSGFLFDNDARALSVDEALWGAYQRAAAELAGQVTTDAAKLARILPASAATPEERARAFVESFGLRAHRRPLTSAEAETYLALYRKGPQAYAGMPAFEGGIRLVLEAFLQSPHFLYRVERSTEAQKDRVPLDDYEVASRLSYGLWGAMPDDALFTAAREGALRSREGVATQARRMLQDARAKSVVEAFHRTLFDVPRYATIRPSPTRFPEVSGRFAEYATRENTLFVRDVVFSRQGRFSDLLTSPSTFVNAELARVYGLSGTYNDDFVPVTLDSRERKGVLTQVGFLASHATSADPDPIHRGVFLSERILCQKIGAPPANIPPLPAPQGRTNREVVASHTEAPGTNCASCHSTLINPLGFPFEGYDAIGRHRTTDNGHPVNASSAPFIGSDQVQVRDALDLADALAASEPVHACYARHWVEYLHGRPFAEEDGPLVERLGKLSKEGGLSIVDLVVEVVTSAGFVNRHPEELP